MLGKGRLYKWLLTVSVLASSTVMTGCYDRQELEQQAFVTTLGIDAAPHGLIDCTLRVALPVNTSSGGSKAGKAPLAGTGPVTYRAHSVFEAMLLANSSIERQVTFSHLTQIIFGSKLAEQGVLGQIQPLVRFREFRPTVLFAVSKTTAREIIADDSPMLEQSTGRIADSIASVGRRTGLIPVAHIHDLSRALESPHEDIAAPLFAINDAVKSDPKGEGGLTSGSQVSFQAGDIKRASGNPVEWGGAALFRGDKVVGYLNAEQTIDLNLLRGHVRTTKMRFEDPKHKSQSIGLVLHQERTPHFHVTLQSGASGRMKIVVEVPFDADIVNVESGVDYSDSRLRAQLEQSLDGKFGAELKALIVLLNQKYQVDVIPISNYVRNDFPTHAAFAGFPWEKKLKDADVAVNVKINIRRFGVQMQPVQLDH